MNVNEGLTALQEWLADEENRTRVQVATYDALARVDGVADAMVDLDAEGEEAVRQKVSGILTAAQGTLREYIEKEMRSVFPDLGDTLREALAQTAGDIAATDEFSTFLDYLIDQAKRLAGMDGNGQPRGPLRPASLRSGRPRLAYFGLPRCPGSIAAADGG